MIFGQFFFYLVCCLLKKNRNFYHNTSNINNQHNWYKIVFLRGKSTNPPLLIGFHTVHVWSVPGSSCSPSPVPPRRDRPVPPTRRLADGQIHENTPRTPPSSRLIREQTDTHPVLQYEGAHLNNNNNNNNSKVYIKFWYIQNKKWGTDHKKFWGVWWAGHGWSNISLCIGSEEIYAKLWLYKHYHTTYVTLDLTHHDAWSCRWACVQLWLPGGRLPPLLGDSPQMCTQSCWCSLPDPRPTACSRGNHE